MPTEIEFMGVALDWTGAWSRKSHKIIRKLGFDESFLEVISMEKIYKSHGIFKKWKTSHLQSTKSQPLNIALNTKGTPKVKRNTFYNCYVLHTLITLS